LENFNETNLNITFFFRLLLQVHHTFASSGELVKSRFIHAAFNDSSTYVAAADHNGKIFIINLQAEKYDLPDFPLSN